MVGNANEEPTRKYDAQNTVDRRIVEKVVINALSRSVGVAVCASRAIQELCLRKTYKADFY